MVGVEDLRLGLRVAYLLGTFEGVTIHKVFWGVVSRQRFWGALPWLSCQEVLEQINKKVDPE